MGSLPVPLYFQVQQLIRHRIATRQYPSGTQIPSENDLGRELRVSRVTVREALRELVRENLLVRAPGRGTFVATDRAERWPLVTYRGCLEDVYERERGLTVARLSITSVAPSAAVRRALGLRATDLAVVQLTRARHLDGQPFSDTVDYIPLDIGRRITRKVIRSRPLNKVFERDLKIPIVSAEETFAVAPAESETAKFLEVPLLSLVVNVRRVMFGTANRAVDIVETSYRADKYQYRVMLARVQPRAHARERAGVSRAHRPVRLRRRR